MKSMQIVMAVLLTLSVSLGALGKAEAANGDGLGDILGKLPIIRGDAVSEGALHRDVVLVAFFASWCPPCKYEFPHLNTIQKAYGDQGFQVIAVNVFETFDGLSTPAKLEAFLDDVDPRFPILKGDAETRRIFGNLDRIPTMFVFDRDGAPAFVFRHEWDAEKTHLTEEELRSVIEPLL
ncbi:MAG: TlpA disulfide reductase family protein [Pseudomonadota bacterium]